MWKQYEQHLCAQPLDLIKAPRVTPSTVSPLPHLFVYQILTTSKSRLLVNPAPPRKQLAKWERRGRSRGDPRRQSPVPLTDKEEGWGGVGWGVAERQAGEGEQAAVDFTYSKTSHLGETAETTAAGQGWVALLPHPRKHYPAIYPSPDGTGPPGTQGSPARVFVANPEVQGRSGAAIPRMY